jgi:hypothetical protein
MTVRWGHFVVSPHTREHPLEGEEYGEDGFVSEIVEN